jgi:hypothetical protein
MARVARGFGYVMLGLAAVLALIGAPDCRAAVVAESYFRMMHTYGS